VRPDIGVATIHYFHFMAGAAVEVLRVQTGNDALIAFSDVIARSMGYYPTKAKIKAIEKREAKS
jgi:hypothetical protein